jgi:hypothetical protein
MQLAPRSVRRWFARHHRWLPYAGAVIVLLTVIVREDFDERWARFAEEINLAQYVFSIKTDTSTLKQRLQCSETSGDKGNTDPESLYRCQAESTASSIEAMLQNIELIVDKLPSENDIDDRFADLRKNAEDGKKELADIVISSSAFQIMKPSNPISGENKWHYHSTASFPASFDVDHSPNLTPTARRFDDVLSSLSALDWDLVEFNQLVLERAQNVRRRNEQYAAHTRWVVIGLVLLGFVIGILAKVYEEEVIDFEG